MNVANYRERSKRPVVRVFRDGVRYLNLHVAWTEEDGDLITLHGHIQHQTGGIVTGGPWVERRSITGWRLKGGSIGMAPTVPRPGSVLTIRQDSQDVEMSFERLDPNLMAKPHDRAGLWLKGHIGSRPVTLYARPVEPRVWVMGDPAAAATPGQLASSHP